MCIIYFNEFGSAYDLDEIRNGCDNNPDGMGLMWVENGKVRTIRGLFDTDTVVEIAKDFDGIPNVLHLRWGTHGNVCEELTHPFRVTPEGSDQHVWMMHNGVISDAALGEKPGKDESDTLVFARQLQAITAAYASTEVLFDDAYSRYLERRIGSYNKVIFLRDDGTINMLHPSRWTKNNETGVWYSNTYSLLPPRYATISEAISVAVDAKATSSTAAAAACGMTTESWAELFSSEEYKEYAAKYGLEDGALLIDEEE